MGNGNNNNMNNISQRATILLIWLILGIYPLLVYPQAKDPELTWLFPKFFFLLFLSLFASYLLFKVPLREPGENQSFLNRLPLLLLFITALTAILSSVNQLVTYHDSLQYVLLGGDLRLNGLLYILGLLVLAATLHKLLSSHWRIKASHRESLLKQALLALSLSGLIQSLIAIAQFLGYSPITRIKGKHLALGTVGNPGIFGILLAISAIASLGLYLSSRDKSKILWAAASVLELFTLGLASNRASILGLFIAFFIWLAIWPSQLTKEKRQKKTSDTKRSIPTSHLLLTFLLAITIASAGYYTSYLKGRKNILDAHTGTARLEIWKLALVSLTKIPGEPFIGGGPDAFRLTLATRVPISKQVSFYLIPYTKYTHRTHGMTIKPLWTKDMPIRSHAWMVSWGGTRRPVIFRFTLDKAHNLFLDRLLAYGLFGTLAWFALFFGNLPALIKHSHPSLLENYSIAAMLVVAFVYGLFWFYSIQIEPAVVLISILAWTATTPTSNLSASNTD